AAAQSRPAATTSSSVAPQATGRMGGLVGELREWLALHRKQEWLLYAGSQAASNAAALSTEHQRLAVRLQSLKEQTPQLAGHAQADPAAPAAPARPADSASLATTTRRIAADQQRLTLLDQRIAALNQLSGVYGNWNAVSAAKSFGILHGILSGVAVVVATLLLLLFLDRWLQRLLGRTRLDRRQVETLRSVTRVALQIVGVLIIFVIIIGVPGQLGTMIGLAGAGLTVALRDFIVAFIGWLVLMGRNGVRLGDWVEINGVSGEVVELGMFHTVLLETGNWNDTSHPTGRRVTFTNSFAVE